MKPTLNHNDLAAFDAVYQTVFFVDASRPATGEVVFQCFRFADSGERGSLDGFNKRFDARDDLVVGFLPMRQVERGAFRETEFQRSTSMVVPSFASRTPWASAARLAAVEVR